MAAGSIQVKGLREFQRACNKAEKDVKSGLKKRLEDAGRTVSLEATRRFAPVDMRSAASIRPRVRTGTVVVEQRRRRTTGAHPDYGAKQMREAFLPALEAKRPEVIRDFEDMLADLVNGF